MWIFPPGKFCREQKADGRAADADMAQKERRLEREARKERHGSKKLESQARIKRADRRDLAEQQQKQQLQPAGEQVEGRDRERAQPRQAQLAERTVGGKEQCRGDDL